MKKLTFLMIVSISTLLLYAQDALLPAYPHEITYQNGRAFFNGQLFTGLLVEKKSNRELGVFQNGYRHGVFSEYYPNGNAMRRIVYSRGVKHGYELEWYENGATRKQSENKNGKLHGRVVEWHPSGMQKSDFSYIDGKIQDGIYSISDETGELEERVTYNNSRIVARYTKKTGIISHFYDSGKLKFSAYLNENDELNDAYTEWWPNEFVKETGHFVNGLKHGIITSWNNNQQKIAEENFKLGKRDSISTYWLNNGIIETHLYKDNQLVNKSAINPANQLGNLVRIANEHLMMYINSDGKPFFILLKFENKNTNDKYIRELIQELLTSSRNRLTIVTDQQKYSNEFISFVVVFSNLTYATTSKYSQDARGMMYTGKCSYQIAKFDNLNTLLKQETFDSNNLKTLFVASFGDKETAIKWGINKADCESYLYQFFPVDGKIIQLSKVRGAKAKQVTINAGAINGVKNRMKFSVYSGEPGKSPVAGEIVVREITPEYSICTVNTGEERILSEFKKNNSLSIRSKL